MQQKHIPHSAAGEFCPVSSYAQRHKSNFPCNKTGSIEIKRDNCQCVRYIASGALAGSHGDSVDLAAVTGDWVWGPPGRASCKTRLTSNLQNGNHSEQKSHYHWRLCANISLHICEWYHPLSALLTRVRSRRSKVGFMESARLKPCCLMVRQTIKAFDEDLAITVRGGPW